MRVSGKSNNVLRACRTKTAVLENLSSTIPFRTAYAPNAFQAGYPMDIYRRTRPSFCRRPPTQYVTRVFNILPRARVHTRHSLRCSKILCTLFERSRWSAFFSFRTISSVHAPCGAGGKTSLNAAIHRCLPRDDDRRPVRYRIVSRNHLCVSYANTVNFKHAISDFDSGGNRSDLIAKYEHAVATDNSDLSRGSRRISPFVFSFARNQRNAGFVNYTGVCAVAIVTHSSRC